MRARIGASSCAVMKMMGTASLSCKSKPLIPCIWTSSTRQAAWPVDSHSRNTGAAFMPSPPPAPPWAWTGRRAIGPWGHSGGVRVGRERGARSGFCDDDAEAVGQSNELGDRARPHLVHDAGAVHLDRLLDDAKLGRDLLVQHAGD